MGRKTFDTVDGPGGWGEDPEQREARVSATAVHVTCVVRR